MSFEAHPEALGAVGVIGALVLAGIRLFLARRSIARSSYWPLLAMLVCGIAFSLTRIVHLTTESTETAMLMVRAQYGIGFLIPGLGTSCLEVMNYRPISRVAVLLIVGGAVISAICVMTPWIVTGPWQIHHDAFGHPHLGGRPGWFAAIVVPAASIIAFVVILRRVRGMPPGLRRKRRLILVSFALFALGGLHDSLVGSGLPSVFMLEYAFVAFCITSANLELTRNVLAHDELEQRLQEKRAMLETREASLDRAQRRLEWSNTRYRHLADATREAVILCAGYQIVDVNQAACRLLGSDDHPMREDVLRRADLRLFVIESERNFIDRLLEDDEGPFEMLLNRSDGTTVAVSVKAVAPPAESRGKRVLLVRDVSAERELQRRLTKSDRLAAVGTLAAGTAHEINNPLAFVLANADFMTERLGNLPLPPELLAEHREMLADITLGANRIRDVVRDLMSLARDRDTGVTDVDLAETLDRCIAMANPQTRHRAHVITSFGAMQPVRANEGRLFQVFLNLIVNAAQAIPEGAVDKNQIRVTGRSEVGHSIIEISDTGSGIPKDVLDRIFEPFFTTKTLGQGTGLGLSISHGIVNDLGGRIEVESVVGSGTTFRVILPSTEAGVATAIVAVGSAPLGPLLRVLVVDDERAVAASLARVLSRHQVEIATSGREALELIANHHYDVAVCDLMMPDVTGIQLYDRLRESQHPLTDRVLFMTGGVFTQDAEAFLQDIGQDRWISKPIPMAELRRMVVELGKKSALRS